MNIKEAKEQIKNAVTAYFSKDEFGNYEIPVERQRPVFLMGAPGIGKTAIIEQIAQEMGIGLVSYSMTHHTRQSALGLPFIVQKDYDGEKYSVSEYTMSEIIASVYDLIEETGVKEGILFLDEINCVSETLAPSMLQFLQYKVFGRHKVPDGWIVVTAGNPPQYNKSVREFDIATWDRLKRIDIEPDFETWKEYALKKRMHGSVVTYLDIKKDNFYKVETTVNGKSFVTARGWDDLSQMIKIYEKKKLKVDIKLIGQYIQNSAAARDFALYYDLYNKYKSDYEIDSIFNGSVSKDIVQRAQKAKFDEKMALLGLLNDKITEKAADVISKENTVKSLIDIIKNIAFEINQNKLSVSDIIDKSVETEKEKMAVLKKSNSLSCEKAINFERVIKFLTSAQSEIIKSNKADSGKESLDVLKLMFKNMAEGLKAQAQETKESLNNMFKFCGEAFGEGQEIVILVTELTMGHYGSAFISRYGCEEYFKYNKELLFSERQKDIVKRIDSLEIDL